MMRTQKTVRQFHSAARPRQGGFTLIEVIIALGIFMLGALAIVRIFPPALAAIQGSGDRTSGTRLATSGLEKMSARIPNTSLSSVADAIYFGSTDGTYSTAFGGAFNGTINRNSSLPRDARLAGNGNPANESALKLGTSPINSGSYVDGERQRVLRDGANALFVLTNFPYTQTTIPPALSLEDYVEGVRIRLASPSGPPKYIFDFSDAKLASSGAVWTDATDSRYPPGTTDSSGKPDCTYYISYKWIEAAAVNTERGVDEEAYVFPVQSAGNGVDALKTALSDRIVSVNTPGFPRSVVQGEVKVRVVRRITTATPTSAEVTAEEDDGLRGLYVIHNPSPAVAAGAIVRVSYAVADWRTVITDQTPMSYSSTNAGAVTLTTRGLDEYDTGDTVFAAAYTATGPAGISTSSLQRGSCAPDSTGTCTSGVAIDKVETKSNETNRITFSAGVRNIKGAKVRISYRPQDGWGVQAAVAARTYTPYLGFTPPAVDNASVAASYGYKYEAWRQYSWQSGSSNIYFQPNEAGKTVQVTFQYLDSGNYYVAQDRIVTISDDLRDVTSAGVISGFTGAGGRVAVAELTDLNGNIEPNVTSILAIRGLSVQSRAFWADNRGRYSQTVVTDYRKAR